MVCSMIFITIVVMLVHVVGAVESDYCKHFGTGRCVCTDEFIECHGEHAIDDNIVALYPYIKDNVENITITESNFTELSNNVFGSCRGTPELVLNRLKFLDLSNNNVHTVHAKTFHCMPHLQSLTLAHNEWQLERKQSHSGFFTSTPELINLDLTNAFEEMWNGSYHIPKLVDVLNVADLTQLKTVNLSLNEFFVFGPDAAASLCKMPVLRTLNLSNNWLEKPVLKDCMKNLVTLDLSNNSMLIIHEDLRKVIDNLPSLQEVRLDQNHYKCDCGLIDTYRWLRTTRAPINRNEMRCFSGYNDSYLHVPILNLSENDLKCLSIPIALNAGSNTDSSSSNTTGSKSGTNADSDSNFELFFILGALFAVTACALIICLALKVADGYNLANVCKRTGSVYDDSLIGEQKSPFE